MHCHGRVSGKEFAGASRLLPTSYGYAQRLGACAKNLNTVHFLMKRFNKI
jgi:hypothetical protein